MRHINIIVDGAKHNKNILFLLTVLALFTFETLWLALKSAFPMAFDEAYHFGLTQFFSGHLNPYITAQDPSTYGFGNIVHNSSWLYHWLLSFPYRVFAFSDSLYVEVVGLRIVNIAIALGSLLVLHRLLSFFSLGYNTRTLVVALFAFTPVVTALSAQINYDNLLLLVSLGVMYNCVKFVHETHIKKPNATTLIWLVLLLLVGPLVKFSFLPILFGVLLVIAWTCVRLGKNRTKHRAGLLKSFRKLPIASRYAATIAIIVVGSVCGLYYGQNFLRYHSLTPTCDQVLSVEACHNYYSWERNYQLAQSFDETKQLQNPVVYSYHWAVTSWYHLYGEIIPTGGIVHIARSFYVILLLATSAAALATLVHGPSIWRANLLLWVLLTISGVYILGLLSRNYHDYRQLGEAVAVQGRYLVPILPIYYTLLVMGVREVIDQSRIRDAKRLKLGLAIFVLFLCVWYGGAVRYISDVLPNHSWKSSTSNY